MQHSHNLVRPERSLMFGVHWIYIFAQCAWDLLHSVEFLTKDGELKEWRKDSGELDTFDYRWSPFQDMPDLAAITAATFRVKRDPDARDNALQLLSRCVFRYPRSTIKF